VPKNNLTKINIARALSKKTGYSVLFSKKLLEDFLRIIKQNIKNSNLILKNFGTFKILKKNQRYGRNPKTNDLYVISARKSISFSCSKKIMNKLNK
tara:strand:- start:473 stop:760 length:288 start_codon:yes stop_codon:yes gene_type:complete